MLPTRHRLVTFAPVVAMTLALAMSSCSSDDSTEAASSRVSTGKPMPSTGQTTPNMGMVPTFAPRRDVAAITPSSEGERTSVVAFSVAELAAGDLTGDGVADLVVTHLRWSSIDTYPLTILVSDGRGNLRDATGELFDGPVPRTQHPRQTILADFNGDHRL
ncbi:MAG: hypothetical protein QOC92_2121, partial [Acidimicrobiaceae bacterium]